MNVCCPGRDHSRSFHLGSPRKVLPQFWLYIVMSFMPNQKNTLLCMGILLNTLYRVSNVRRSMKSLKICISST